MSTARERWPTPILGETGSPGCWQPAAPARACHAARSARSSRKLDPFGARPLAPRCGDLAPRWLLTRLGPPGPRWCPSQLRGRRPGQDRPVRGQGGGAAWHRQRQGLRRADRPHQGVCVSAEEAPSRFLASPPAAVPSIACTHATPPRAVSPPCRNTAGGRTLPRRRRARRCPRLPPRRECRASSQPDCGASKRPTFLLTAAPL